MEKRKEEIHRFFQLCADIEGAMAELYVFFAEAYRDVPGMEALFQKTAAEELNHANQFQMAIRHFTPHVSGLNQSVECAERHLELARSILRNVRTSVPRVEEALRRSINMEETFGHFHMDTAVKFDDENCTKMFKALMAADVGHKECLEMALKLQEYRKQVK